MAEGPVTVRMSALLGRRVVDEQGVDHGHVIDVRVVQDGPVTDLAKAQLRVDGLVVGPDGIGARLGLLRHRVQGPVVLVVLARWLGRGTRYVRWDALAVAPGPDADEPVRIVAPADGHLTERP